MFGRTSPHYESKDVIKNGRNLILKFQRENCKKWKIAFWLVLHGPASSVGTGFKWKQSLLSLSIGWMIYSPLLTFYHSLPYRGAIPPEAPLVKSTGRIIFGFEPGLKSTPLARFVVDTGKRLKLQDPSGLETISEWQNQNPSSEIYVEGFLLRDGSGLFWMTYVAGADGKVLLNRTEQVRELKLARDPFNSVLLWMYITSVPMWLISINNVRKVKNLIGA